MNSLSEKIDTLYAAFSDVPKPTRIDGCDCCISGDEIAALLSKPLRTLGGTELSSYASSAFLTVGQEADYLYLLPRILEISCLDSFWWPDVEITGRAIGDTNPAGWPDHRRLALQDVLHAVLQNAVEGSDGWTMDGWICAIGRMRLDLAPFLQQIENSPQALLAYYEENTAALVKSRLVNSFWEKTEPGYQETVDWFESPKVALLISEAFAQRYNPS